MTSFFAARPRLANAALALWIAYDAGKLVQIMWASSNFIADALIAAALLVMLVNVLRRPRVRASDWSPAALLCALVSLFVVAFAVFAADGVAAPHVVTTLIEIAAAALLLWAVAAIGTSFAVLPALIVVRTRGPYRFVRHPIYLAYMLSGLALALSYRDPLVTGAVLIEALAFIARIHLEERLLGADVDYARYAAQVRWRLFPGLY